MASFEKWQQLRPQNPPWMRGPNTGALVGGLGKVKDQLAARLRAGILSRFPDSTLAADDALAYKGAERLLPRGPGESSTAYAARLQAAWETWMLAGSHGALLRQLEIAGFGGARIIQDNGLWTKLAIAPGSTDFTARLVATTGLPSWTYTPGIGRLTAPSNGAQSYDSVPGVLGDQILIAKRVSIPAAPNTAGVYDITQVGDSTHPAILQRTTGWQSSDLVTPGQTIGVTAGATLAGAQFEVAAPTAFTTNSAPPHIVGGPVSGGVIFADTNTNLALGRPAWMFDFRTVFWSRFVILWTGAVSGLATADGQQALRAIVDRWRPAYSTYVGSIQLTAGSTWGWPPDRSWVSTTWGGSSTIFLGP